MERYEREIGGYFEFEHFEGNEYHQEALRLDCARNCLGYLIEARKITRIWIPYWMCQSVHDIAKQHQVSVQYYEITPSFSPDYSKIDFDEGDYLYLVDYYGQLSSCDFDEAIAFSDARIIVDEVMSFFRKPIPGVDTIYSCRKFFGVSDGAYLYTSASINRKLPVSSSHEYMISVLGRAEGSSNDFFGDSQRNNERFRSETISIMSPITANILRAIDYQAVSSRRRSNFEYVASRLGTINQLHPHPVDGAFMYPLLLDNGFELRKRMQQKKIYISTFWTNVTNHNGLSGRYARDILPMIIDQRYDIDDMRYMCDLLESEYGD